MNKSYQILKDNLDIQIGKVTDSKKNALLKQVLD